MQASMPDFLEIYLPTRSKEGLEKVRLAEDRMKSLKI